MPLPALEYPLSHPHPRGHIFLLASVVIFILALPVLVIVNLVTLGSELVPTLQSHFQPNETELEGWWGTRRLPPLLRPKPPRCEPKDLGRGDSFRLTASLFDYTVMSTWNTSKSHSPTEVQEQERVEYKGQSFADCYVDSARFDFSLLEQTQTVTAGVTCPGTRQDYPIYVSMETSITFAWDLSKDFIGQYYGPGLGSMNISDGTSTDYRKVVLAVLDMIATDSLTIMRRGQLLTDPVLAISTFNHVDPKNGGPIPATSALTYLNGTVADTPGDTEIYALTIYNLLCVVIDAVNLDLGSKMYSNMFRNATMFNLVIQPNQAPPGVNSSDWAGGDSSRSFYYGTITPPYQTWAEMLLNGKPFQLSSVTGLEGQETAMVTTYLCPSYQVKPLSSLLTSVFVGSATMTLSAWGVWMLFTTFLAKKIMPPLVQCHCQMCEEKKRQKAAIAAQHAEAVRIAEAANPGVLMRLAVRLGLARPAAPARSPSNSDDEEKANSDSAKSSGNPERLGTSTQAARPTDSLDIKHLSYASGSTTA